MGREAVYYLRRIHDMSKYGFVNLVKYRTVEVNPVEELRKACQSGHVNIVRLFLQQGFRLEDLDLTRTFCQSDITILRLFETFYSHFWNNYSFILLQACRNGHLGPVKLFLESRPRIIRLKDTHCLSWAAENGQTWMVKFLIQNGFENYGDSLTLASKNGHRATVKFLLRNRLRE